MITPTANDLPPIGAILSGPHWPTRVRVVRVEPRGTSRVLIEAVTLDDRARLVSRLLKRDDLAGLEVEAEADRPTLAGDPAGFRLAAEATRIRLAHTYDPQFAVSVARIDPLPHQLEAVYYYMLHQPRLRFLLADDPGAGKTIMAGLLLKELKLRGAIIRTLIVAPANLAPQWQRELAEKFDEPFDLVDRAALADLPEDAPELERWGAEERALRLTVARNLDELEAEIAILTDLAAQALAVEESGPERKLDELRRVIDEINLFHSGEKLLIFTEAKDTFDYLVENLTAWGLAVTHIDDTMAPPERYRAEEVFRDPEGAQVMVATEAAGEGINLQFCHLLLNYDLLSRGPAGQVRYIEVKGRAGVGAVELSANEWLKAEQLGQDYWLYIVTDALTSPAVHRVQDPAHRLDREEVVPQVRYRIRQEGWQRVAESVARYETSPGRKES